MSWGIVSAVSTVVAVGGSIYGAKKAKDAAEADRDAANARSEAQAEADAAALDFEKERYADWQEVYGSVEQNLADYYNNVSADYYEVQGLQAFNEEAADVQKQVQEDLAQRGIQGSGIGASIGRTQQVEDAQSRAQIRVDAPRRAAEEKRGFLQIGLGQNPADNVSSALQSSASRAERGSLRADELASSSEAAAGKAAGQAITSIATGLSDYAKR